MSRRHVQYLLIGGGLAGSSAAVAIRARDSHGSVMLVGQEVNRPYHRPPLSKDFLVGRVNRDSLFTLDERWFAQHDVELQTGRRATSLNTARQCVGFDSGEEVAFDRLLLATGGSARALSIPGAEMAGVYTLRSLEDAIRLHHAAQSALREGQMQEGHRGWAAVVGDGLLAVEVAGSLRRLGLGIHLLMKEHHPWPGLAGETTGRVIANILQEHGVTVHPASPPVRFDGDGRVQRVTTAAGVVLPCDFVVAAVGMTPNRSLVRGTAIAAERAILVDERCRTSVPGIFAAGDCAAVRDPVSGKYRSLEHWRGAAATGSVAGANMAGGDEVYCEVNHYTTQVFGLSAAMWGESRHVDHRLIRGSASARSPGFVEIGVSADSRVCQAIRVGEADDNDVLSWMVTQRLQVTKIVERLKDASIPIR